MMRVLVTPIFIHNQRGPYCEALEAGGFDVVFPPTGLSLKEPATLIEQLDGIDAVIASIEPYTREVLTGTSLRVIARNGVGYDSVDVAAATDVGIPVTITPGANQQAVAEHAVALMLSVAHGFPGRDKEVRGGNWQRKILPRLAGKTLGLLGLGAIGKTVVPLAAGLGMRVIAHDPLPDRDFAARHDVKLVSLDELLEHADVVSLHLPCTPGSTDLINARTLAKMKPGAIFINTSRGGLVDEDALAEALRSGHLLGAGLDVFKLEPLPTDSPLVQLDNVLLCPHMAGGDRESVAKVASLAADSILQLHQGRWPEGRVVNAELRQGWKW